MTSAPMSASISVQVGPAMTCVRSTTFNPDRGPIVSPAISCFYFVLRLLAVRDPAEAYGVLLREVGCQRSGPITFACRPAGEPGFCAVRGSLRLAALECEYSP